MVAPAGLTLKEYVDHPLFAIFPQLGDLDINLSADGLLTSGPLTFEPPLDGPSQGYPANISTIQWRGNKITGDTMMYASRELVQLMGLVDGTYVPDTLAEVIWDIGVPFKRTVARDGKAYYVVTVPNPDGTMLVLAYYIGLVPRRY